MPNYSYIAKSFQGETETGIQEAKNKHQLAQILRRKGYVLISAELKEKTKKGSSGKFWQKSLPFFQKVSLAEKMMFTRNLRVMIGAGISLPKALDTLAKQAKSKKLSGALLKIKEEIMKGKSFSESLSHYPKIFSELFCNMVKVGEESGTLEDVLKHLTNQMEREHDLKSKVKGAMLYPAVILSAMIGIGILMLVMVVPKLAETFEELQIELPATTQFVMSLGTFLSQKLYLFILIVLVLFFSFRAILKTKPGKRTADNLILRLPIISSLTKKTNSAITVRTLSALIASGIPLVRTLEIISGILGNVYYKEAIQEASKKVQKGEKLSESLKPYSNLYPLTVNQMIEVGEETGETSEVLAKLADFFEEEVNNTTKNFSSIIEPVLMIIIGAAVGFFAVSMIQPMYSMLGAI